MLVSVMRPHAVFCSATNGQHITARYHPLTWLKGWLGALHTHPTILVAMMAWCGHALPTHRAHLTWPGCGPTSVTRTRLAR